MQKCTWGTTKNGEVASLYTLENKNGMKAVVSDFGALLISLYVPNNQGEFVDVVLGMDTLEQYENNSIFLGATVGRSANRIEDGKFTLNGRTYQLAQNDGKNNLHSCPGGYHERMWLATPGENSINFTLESPDGDQGYPGKLLISVTYTLTDENELKLHYQGACNEDTVVNLTNHSYFNLSGHDSGTAANQKVWIDADYYTEADEGSIPTGKLIPVAGTPMDFTVPKLISDEMDCDYPTMVAAGGYDHNWVLKNNRELALVASLEAEEAGRKMLVYTDLPGVQFYGGNFINGTLTGKGGHVYQKREGVCFESQFFPNAINRENFDSPVLKAGDAYDTTTIYKFV